MSLTITDVTALNALPELDPLEETDLTTAYRNGSDEPLYQTTYFAVANSTVAAIANNSNLANSIASSIANTQVFANSINNILSNNYGTYFFFTMAFTGAPPPSSTLPVFLAPEEWTLSANAVGSSSKFTVTSPGSGITLGVLHNGSSIGTLAFNTSGVGVFTTVDTVFAVGDSISFSTPSNLQSATGLLATIEGRWGSF